MIDESISAFGRSCLEVIFMGIQDRSERVQILRYMSVTKTKSASSSWSFQELACCNGKSSIFVHDSSRLLAQLLSSGLKSHER